MLDLTPETATPKSILLHLLERASMPFFLFSLVLCSSLLLSQAFLLPRLTHVTVAGKELDALSLRSFQADLLQQIGIAQDKRTALFSPVDDAAFTSARDTREQETDITVIRSDLQNLARSFADGDKPVIVLTDIHLDAAMHQLMLTGDVRNSGPQSLTVLATFRAEFEKLPWVKHLEPGTFERLDDATLGIHSPIAITAQVQ